VPEWNVSASVPPRPSPRSASWWLLASLKCADAVLAAVAVEDAEEDLLLAHLGLEWPGWLAREWSAFAWDQRNLSPSVRWWLLESPKSADAVAVDAEEDLLLAPLYWFIYLFYIFIIFVLSFLFLFLFRGLEWPGWLEKVALFLLDVFTFCN
jgi:hypothetical protein